MMTNRVQWVRPLILSLALLPALGCRDLEVPTRTAARSPETPPNMILITIDTLRADHLPVYGYPRDITPFLSKLAEQSVVFENARATSSHTAPSHASMFTGLHAPQHRLLENGQPLHEQFPTIADVLARRGYRTAAVTTAKFLKGVGRGFSDFIKPGEDFGNASWIVDRGIEWVDNLDPEESYFLWLHFFDVHEWNDEDRHDQATSRALPSVSGPHGPSLLEYLAKHQGNPLEHLRSEQDLLGMVDAYDAQIMAVDRELARLYRALEGNDSETPTMWAITSDHGEGLGNHGHRGHGKHIYNEQLHVPLLFHDPAGSWTPTRVDELVELIHLGPTFLDLAGTSFDDGREDRPGRPLTPLLTGTGTWGHRFAFAVRRPADEFRLGRGWSPGEVFALQEGSLKIIVDTAGSTEFYDLDADPYEQNRLNEKLPRVGVRLERRAARIHAALQASNPELEVTGIDPAHIEELRALGYL